MVGWSVGFLTSSSATNLSHGRVFADDLALLSHNKKQMQNKTDLLKVVLEKTGLKINKSKTEVMKINTSVTTPITVVGEHVKEVESFVYLGSLVDKKGGTDQDVKARVGKARGAFVLLKKIWGSTEISTGTKLRIFNSNVKSVLLSGCETWRITKALHQKIQCCVNTCLRRILGIRWPDRISNTDLWERAGQEPLAKQILQRKWGWIGHTLRKPPANITRQVLSWNPQGKRRRGLPCNSWRRDTEAELKAQKLSWKGACDAAQNRVCWRGIVDGLCSNWSRPKYVSKDTLSCDGLHENPLALGPCKRYGPVRTLP